MTIRLKVLLTVIFLLLYSFAFGQTTGGNWGAWLESASDARNTALGHAGAGLADDVWAARANPAGLGQLLEGQANFTYAQPFADVSDISFGSLGVARPLIAGSFTPGTFALNVSYFNAGGIPEAYAGGTTGRTFSDNDLEILISWGKGFGEDFETKKPNDFFVGTNFKLYSQKVGDYHAKAFGMDVGILQKPIPELSWGVNLRNLVPPASRFAELGDLAPTAFVGGLSGKICNLFTLTAEGSIDSDLIYDAAGGLEFKLVNMFALRGGYRLSDEAPAFGAGVRSGKVGLDYAGVINQDLGIGHRLTFNLWF
jgi:hypothetical protein